MFHPELRSKHLEDSNSTAPPNILRGNRRFRSWEGAGSTEEGTLAEEDTPAEGTLVGDTHPLDTLQLDNLEEEELQQEAAADCSNSSLFFRINSAENKNWGLIKERRGVL